MRSIVGFLGEAAAKQYLKTKGYKIIHSNWRCKIGELDLVCWDGAELVFVEVKTRVGYLRAKRRMFDTITLKKRRKLRRLVDAYLRFGMTADRIPPHRIDVVGVLLSGGRLKVVYIEHLIAAV